MINWLSDVVGLLSIIIPHLGLTSADFPILFYIKMNNGAAVFDSTYQKLTIHQPPKRLDQVQAAIRTMHYSHIPLLKKDITASGDHYELNDKQKTCE